MSYSYKPPPGASRERIWADIVDMIDLAQRQAVRHAVEDMIRAGLNDDAIEAVVSEMVARHDEMKAKALAEIAALTTTREVTH